MQTLKFDSYQRRAIKAPPGDLVISAVAGSGKTTVLAARINRLIAHGTDPAEIHAITFTQAGGRALRAKIDQPIAYAGTLHALLCKWGGIDPREIYGEAAETALISEAIAIAGLNGFTLRKARGILQGDDVWLGDNGVFLKTFERLLESRGGTTFDTILRRFADEKYPKAKPRVGVLLIDEYQDSSRLDDACYRAMKPDQVMVVGDPNQAIYGFRGADPTLLRRAMRRNGSYEMPISYRCAAKIAEAAGAISGRDFRPAPDAETGIVAQCRLRTRNDELKFLIGQAQSVLGIQSVAILARYNSEVDEIRAAFELEGVPLRPRIGKKRRSPSLEAHVAYFNGSIGFARFLSGIESWQRDRIEAKWGGTEPLLSSPLKARLDAIYAPDEIKAFIGGNPAKAMERLLGLDPDSDTGTGASVFVDTVHASKGLEFDTVILSGATTERWDRKAYQLENLCYVALTRARRVFRMTSAGVETDPHTGRTVKTKPCTRLDAVIEA